MMPVESRDDGGIWEVKMREAGYEVLMMLRECSS